MVPTRNRPTKLRTCMDCLDIAQKLLPFDAVICDSSTPEYAKETRDVVSDFPWARYVSHSGKNVSAARNICLESAQGDILINVDDDVYVDPDAIYALATRISSHQNQITAGAVSWSGVGASEPVKMRRIGYGRKVIAEETPDFIIGAFFGYTSIVAHLFPWNERIQSSDDRFMGACWRSHNFILGYEPAARAHHDADVSVYDEGHQRSHIYANLFDAVLVRRSISWILSFEILGFAAGWRGFSGRLAKRRYVQAWIWGNIDFCRDFMWLRSTYIKGQCLTSASCDDAS